MICRMVFDSCVAHCMHASVSQTLDSQVTSDTSTTPDIQFLPIECHIPVHHVGIRKFLFLIPDQFVETGYWVLLVLFTGPA